MADTKKGNLKVTLDIGGKIAEVEAEPHSFKSGSDGFYFRERVSIGGKSYHVQIIISVPK